MKQRRNSGISETVGDSRLYLDSWSALEEYLRFKPDAIVTINCAEKERARLDRLLSEFGLSYPIVEESPELKVYIQVNTRQEWEFDEKSRSDDHGAIIVATDHITDTRNLGAILRSAAFFGVKSVIMPKKRQASIGHGTIKTCQGALSLLDVYQVANLSRALEKLKKQGYWVIGADGQGDDSAQYIGKFEKVVIVLGSEDKGMSKNIADKCDVIAAIPGAGSLESLNVAVAAGIFLQQFSRP